MRAADMVVCDTEGFLVDGPSGITQCSEVKIHSCIYKTRHDVQSVVHVHPRFTVLLSVLRIPLVPMCQEGIQLVRNPLPVYSHVKTIQSEEEGMEVVRLLGDGSAIILQGHGAVTTGHSLAQSVTAMLQLEEQARMNYYAYCAMGREHPRIPEELFDEMTNRPPLHTLSHFQVVLQGRGLSGTASGTTGSAESPGTCSAIDKHSQGHARLRDIDLGGSPGCTSTIRNFSASAGCRDGPPHGDVPG
jgi:ribulose-5-phosphate 4-epimerase/fuculose-1-phosphate aldolase